MHHLARVRATWSRIWASTGGRVATILVGILFAAIGFGFLFIYSGAFNAAADDPHSDLVYWAAQTTRVRSIQVRASDIVVPSNLNDPARISAGAAQYAEMCSQCHLAPGMAKTEISQGLYPRAPELSRGTSLTTAEIFWVIKHGIKMTGMPSWGATHNDELLWHIVAFLRKLPNLSPEQYAAMVKSAPQSHDEMMEDDHQH